MKKYFVYLTINNTNQKKYIGKHYGEETDNYLGSGTLLIQAINKYGAENFSRSILQFANSEEEAFSLEKEYINKYNAIHSREFYNLHEGGRGGNTKAGWSKEQKENYSKKMSEITKGRNNGMYGKSHSKQTISYLKNYAQNVRDNSVYRTQDFREKISKLTKGENNGMYGKKHNEDTKKIMSINRQGKICGAKNGMYGKSRDKAINGKRVCAIDEAGNIIMHFVSKREALSFLGVKGHTGLDKAIKNGNKYHGYYWR